MGTGCGHLRRALNSNDLLERKKRERRLKWVIYVYIGVRHIHYFLSFLSFCIIYISSQPNRNSTADCSDGLVWEWSRENGEMWSSSRVGNNLWFGGVWSMSKGTPIPEWWLNVSRANGLFYLFTGNCSIINDRVDLFSVLRRLQDNLVNVSALSISLSKSRRDHRMDIYI